MTAFTRLADIKGFDRSLVLIDSAYISGLALGQRNPTTITLWYAAEEALEAEVHLLLREENS